MAKEAVCFRCGNEEGAPFVPCNDPGCPKVYHVECLTLKPAGEGEEEMSVLSTTLDCFFFISKLWYFDLI